MIATFDVKVDGLKVGEEAWVKETSIQIYRMTAAIMNVGVTDYFNKDPRWDDVKEIKEDSEMWNDYGELMMNIAEVVSKWIGVKDGRIVKLTGGLDCVLFIDQHQKVCGDDYFKGEIQCKVEDYKNT